MTLRINSDGNLVSSFESLDDEAPKGTMNAFLARATVAEKREFVRSLLEQAFSEGIPSQHDVDNNK